MKEKTFLRKFNVYICDKVQIWYRYNNEKDFEIYEVVAPCDKSAKRKALDMHNIGIPFKIEII